MRGRNKRKPKSEIKTGDTVKVNFSANQWATGETIPQWVKGESYKVQQVAGNKILLTDIFLGSTKLM